MTRDLVIGLLNNMPDAVLLRTEAQFYEQVARSAPGRAIRLELFALPGVPREEAARREIERRYRPFDALFSLPLDGLIVTGLESCAAPLREAPYWPALAGVIEGAATRAMPSVWSCLAAHAAVLHLDRIERRPRPEKLSGLYQTVSVAPDHALTQGLTTQWWTPHSRRYGLDARDLADAGYRVLTKARAPTWSGGVVDAFTRADLPFLYLQGHPEYDSRAVLREYARDVRRFIDGAAVPYPHVPVAYFDDSLAASFALLQFRAEQSWGGSQAALLVEELGALVRGASVRDHDQPGRTTLFSNWVAGLCGLATNPAPAPAPLLARRA